MSITPGVTHLPLASMTDRVGGRVDGLADGRDLAVLQQDRSALDRGSRGREDRRVADHRRPRRGRLVGRAVGVRCWPAGRRQRRRRRGRRRHRASKVVAHGRRGLYRPAHDKLSVCPTTSAGFFVAVASRWRPALGAEAAARETCRRFLRRPMSPRAPADAIRTSTQPRQQGHHARARAPGIRGPTRG